MHASFFGMKRVHLRVLAVTRPMISDYELTPARFDMLRIVLGRPHGVHQGTLQWLLGVSAATVSRMLKSLQGLGFVVRERDARDARRVIVHLTAPGKVAVRMALEATVVNREADRTAARGVLGSTRTASDSFDETYATIAAGREKLSTLDRLLDDMRKAFADRAPFRHPWRIGDLMPLAFTTVVDGRIRSPDVDALGGSPG